MGDLSLRLQTQLGHDSNVFRDADSTPSRPAAIGQPTEATGVPNPPPAVRPVGATASSTLSTRLDAAAGIPLASDQTRLILATQLELNRYPSASAVNHSAHTTAGQLDWRLSERWHTQLQAGQQRSPYPFDDLYPRLDPVTRDWLAAELQLRITPDLALPAGVARARTRHSDRATHAGLDVDQHIQSLSLRYRSPLGNEAEVGWLLSQRDYPFRQAGRGPEGAIDSREREWFGSVQWVISPKTQAQWRIATRQTEQAGRTRDQLLYNLYLGHSPLPPWRIDAVWWNRPTPITDAELARSTSRGWRLGLTWTPTPKLSAEWSLLHNRQTDESLNPERQRLDPRERRHSLRLVWDWQPQLSAIAQASRYSLARANGTVAHQNTWMLGLDLRFENSSGAAQRTRLTPRSFD